MITVKDLLTTKVTSSPDGQRWEPCLPQYLSLRVRIRDAWAVLFGNAVAIRQTTKSDIY